MLAIPTYDATNPSFVRTFSYDIRIYGDELLRLVRRDLQSTDMSNALFLEVPGTEVPLRYLSDTDTLESAEAEATMKLCLLPEAKWPSYLISPAIVDYLRDPSDFIQDDRMTAHGGYGHVYVARDRRTQVECSFKRIVRYTKPEDKRLWLREISVLSSLHFPSIVAITGVILGDIPTIITKFERHSSLPRYLTKTRQPLTDTQKMIILYGVARGMQFLHKRSLIHRDLKPDNILLNERLEPLICDFGFSKRFGLQSNIFATITGTLGYSPPEVISGHVCSFPVDCFSYAMSAYEVITGRNPCDGIGNPRLSEHRFNEAIMDGKRPEFPSWVCPSARDFVDPCWAGDPARRPTFDEIVEVLESKKFILPDVDHGQYDAYIRSLNFRDLSCEFGRVELLTFPICGSISEIEREVSSKFGVPQYTFTLECDGKLLSDRLAINDIPAGSNIIVKLFKSVSLAKAQLGRRHHINPQYIAFSRDGELLADTADIDKNTIAILHVHVQLSTRRIISVETTLGVTVGDLKNVLIANHGLSPDILIISRGIHLKNDSTLADKPFPLTVKNSFIVRCVLAHNGTKLDLPFTDEDTVKTVKLEFGWRFAIVPTLVLVFHDGRLLALDSSVAQFQGKELTVRVENPHLFQIHLRKQDGTLHDWNVRRGATFADVRAELSVVDQLPQEVINLTVDGELVMDSWEVDAHKDEVIDYTLKEVPVSLTFHCNARTIAREFAGYWRVKRVREYWAEARHCELNGIGLFQNSTSIPDDRHIESLPADLPIVVSVEEVHFTVTYNKRPMPLKYGQLETVCVMRRDLHRMLQQPFPGIDVKRIHFRNCDTNVPYPPEVECRDLPLELTMTIEKRPMIVIKVDGEYTSFEFNEDATVREAKAALGVEFLLQDGRELTDAEQLATLPDEKEVLAQRGGHVVEFVAGAGADADAVFRISFAGAPPGPAVAKARLCESVVRLPAAQVTLTLTDATVSRYRIDVKGDKRSYRLTINGRNTKIELNWFDTVRVVRRIIATQFELLDVRLVCENKPMELHRPISYYCGLDGNVVVKGRTRTQREFRFQCADGRRLAKVLVDTIMVESAKGIIAEELDVLPLQMELSHKAVPLADGVRLSSLKIGDGEAIDVAIKAAPIVTLTLPNGEKQTVRVDRVKSVADVARQLGGDAALSANGRVLAPETKLWDIPAREVTVAFPVEPVTVEIAPSTVHSFKFVLFTGEKVTRAYTPETSFGEVARRFAVELGRSVELRADGSILDPDGTFEDFEITDQDEIEVV